MADLLLGVKIGVQGGPQSVKEIKAIDDQVRKLQEQNARVAATAKALKDAYNLSDAEVGQLVSELQRLENQTKGVTREARSLDAVFQGLLQGFGQQLTQIGFQAFTGSVRGIKDAIGGSISSFIEFEGALRQAGAISGSLGTQEFQNLSDEIDRLGIVTSKTPQEIANTAVSLAKAGFSAGELTQAMEGITRASEATGESLELVGDIIAKTLRMFSLEASETSRVANVLVQTANSSNTSVAGLGDSLRYVGPTAKSANQSIESTAVLLGLLGDAGLQGGQAGTNLAQAIDSLKLASAGVNTEFTSLVRGNKRATAAYEVLSARVRDSNGEVRNLLEVIPELKAGLANLGKADQDIVLKALFGVEGKRAFEVIINTAGDRVEKLTEDILILSQIGEGAAVKTGKALLEGLKGSFDLIGGSIGSLQNQLGKAFAPGLEGAIRLVTDVINKVLEAGDAFTAIEDAGLRFTETLQANPQLATQLADAFTQIAQVISQGIADQLDRITVALQSNPDLVRNLAQSLVAAAQQAGLFVSRLIDVAATVGTIGASFAGAAGSIFTSIAPTLTALVNVINSVVVALQPLLANTKLVEVAFQALVLQMLAVRAAALASTFSSLAGGLVSLVKGIASATAAMAAFNTAQATGSRSALLLGQSLAGNAAAATASARGFTAAAATTAAAAAKFALLAAAVASVSTALSRFKDGGAELKEGTEIIRESLAKSQAELVKTRQALTDVEEAIPGMFPSQPPPTDFIDGITAQLVKLNDYVIEIQNRIPGLQQILSLLPGNQGLATLLPDVTNAEKQLNDQKIQLGNLLTATDELIAANDRFGGSQEEAAKRVDTYNVSIEQLRKAQESFDPSKMSQPDYEAAINSSNAYIKALENERREFQQRFGLIDNFDDLAKKNATTLDEIALKSEQTIQDLKDKGSPQQEILNVEKKALDDRLQENKRYSLQLKNAIEAGILDPQQVRQANDEIMKSEQEVVSLREQIRDKRNQIAKSISDAAASAAAKEKASLEDLTAGNQQALSQLEIQAAQAQEALLKSGGDPAKLAQAEKTSLEQRIAENKKFLESLKGLKGLEGEEAAKVADQIRQTELTLANDRVALARQVLDAKKQAEEAAKQAAIKALEDRLRIDQTAANLETQRLDLQTQAIQAEQQLLAQQQGVETALLTLERERLETKLSQAEAEGRTAESKQLQQQIDQLSQESIAQEFEFKRQQLELEFALAQAENQRAVVLSQIAIIEAEIAVSKAQANGATTQEITQLQEVVKLRKDAAQAAKDAAGVTDELFSARREELGIQENISKENQKQSEAQKKQAEAEKNKTAQTEAAGAAQSDVTGELGKQEGLAQKIADLEQKRADLLVQALSTSKQETAESLKQLDTIRSRFKEAQQAGLFQGVGGEFEAAAAQLEGILKSGGNLKDLIQFAQSNNSQIATQLLEAVGRGDVLKLIEADQASQAFQSGGQTAGDEIEQGIVRGGQQAAASISGALSGGSLSSLITPLPRKDGGPVAAGQAYLVGEEGPELITPSRRGWVHTAGETAAMMSKQPTMLVKNPDMPGVESKLSELLQEVRRGRRVAVPTSYTLNTVNPLQDAVALQIKQVRALARGRVL